MLKRVILILVLMAVLPSCASGTSQPNTDLRVEMTDFAYTPSSITVPVGQPVILTLDNMGNIEHDFVIESIGVTTEVIEDNGSNEHHAHGAQQNYDLHVSARASEMSIVKVTIAKPGTYKIFCSVEGHEEAGMIGELIVLDQD